MTGIAIWRWAAVAMMALMAAENLFARRHDAAIDKYHRAIHDAAGQVPSRIGAWVGQDLELQKQAVAVLRPNVMISRRYVNVEDGTVAGLTLVHCADAHHMVGHFPLRCYPAEGWTVVSHADRDWVAEGMTFTGTEYAFTRSEEPPGGGTPVEHSLIVVNCLLRPGGAILRDGDAMSRTIVGAAGQASGAGQMQIYFDGSIPRERRDAAVVELTGGSLPLIRPILEKLPS